MNKKEIIAFYKLMLQLILIVLFLILLIPVSQFVDFSTENEKQATITKIQPKVKPEIVDGIHLETGLKVDENWELVQTNCTRCHNATIITNSQFTRDGWKDLIVWMQKTQGLWKLGENEDKILDYLSKNYAPGESKGRRVPLEIKEEEWYVLE